MPGGGGGGGGGSRHGVGGGLRGDKLDGESSKLDGGASPNKR